MMYLSRGIPTPPHGDGVYRVSHCGRIYALGPESAALWQSGQFAPRPVLPGKDRMIARMECARLIKKQREVFGSGYRKKPQNMTRTAALRFRNTQKRSRANKNRIQPTGTPRTRNVSPGRFLFENLSFSQVKSRRK